MALNTIIGFSHDREDDPYLNLDPYVKNTNDEEHSALVLGSGSRGIVSLLKLGYRDNYAIDIFDPSLAFFMYILDYRYNKIIPGYIKDKIKEELPIEDFSSDDSPDSVFCTKHLLGYFYQMISVQYEDKIEVYNFFDEGIPRRLTILRMNYRYTKTIDELLMLNNKFKLVVAGNCSTDPEYSIFEKVFDILKANHGTFYLENITGNGQYFRISLEETIDTVAEKYKVKKSTMMIIYHNKATFLDGSTNESYSILIRY
jgi:hypothetical protein